MLAGLHLPWSLLTGSQLEGLGSGRLALRKTRKPFKDLEGEELRVLDKP
jgi:hypothetical protein